MGNAVGIMIGGPGPPGPPPPGPPGPLPPGPPELSVGDAVGGFIGPLFCGMGVGD